VLLLTGHTLKDSEYTMLYHRGELLRNEELAGAPPEVLAEHAALRREPVVLDADVDKVLRLLEAQQAAEKRG
jgi:threonine synthase